MATVSINGKINTDWNMDFLGKSIEAPKVKTKSIDVPLRDGIIDLTEALDGIVHYNNREIEMRFEIRAERIEWPHLQMELANAYHGKTVQVIFDDDSDHYWTGRAYVSEIADHKSTAGIKITVEAEPFRRTVASLITKTYASETTQEDINLEGLGHSRLYIKVNDATTPNPGGGGRINWTSLVVTVDGESYRVTYNTKNPNLYLPVLTDNNTSISVSVVANYGMAIDIIGGDL